MEVLTSSFLRKTALTMSAAVALSTGACDNPLEGEWRQVPGLERAYEAGAKPPEGLDVRKRSLGVYVVTIMQEGRPTRNHGYDNPEKVEEIINDAVDSISQSTLGVEQIDAENMGSYVVEVGTSKERCRSEDKWFKFIKDAGRAAKFHAQLAGKHPNEAGEDLFLVDLVNCADTEKRQANGLPVKSGIIGLADSFDRASYVFHGPMATDVTKHELGHRLGLGHSGLQNCKNLGVGEWGVAVYTGQETCDVIEYGDGNSAMGNSKLWEQPDIFNGPQLAQLGVIRPEQIVDVTDSGSFEISSLLTPDASAPKLLRVKALRPNLRNASSEDGHPTRDDLYYYIELSSLRPSWYKSDKCKNPTPEMKDCFRADNVSVKIYIAPKELKGANIAGMRLYPHQGESTEEAGLEKTGRNLFVEQYGSRQMEISLLKLEPDFSGKANAGKAMLKLEFGEPKALESYQTGDATGRYTPPVGQEE